MAQDTPSRKLDQYIVRFPDGMRDRLKAVAAENGRSLNAEIIARLEASFRQGGGGDMQDILAKVLDQQVRIVETMEQAGFKLPPARKP